LIDGGQNITDHLARKLSTCGWKRCFSGDPEMSIGAACARQEGQSSALQRLEKGRYYSPHMPGMRSQPRPRTASSSPVMTQKMVTTVIASGGDEEEDGYEVSPMTALTPTDWI
jgi:hypothetical protein